MSDEQGLASPATIRHTVGANGTFGLNNVSGDIRIRGEETDEIVVMARWENGDKDKPLPLVVRRGEGSLHIDTDDRSGWISFRHHGSIEFEVTVPRNARVDISSVSSDIESHHIYGDQTYKTVSGDLLVDGTSGRVSATTVSGDLQLTAIDALEANLTTTSGDVEAFAKTFAPVRVRTVSGDVDLRGGFASGPQHTVETVSGDLSIDAMSGLSVDTKRGLDFSKQNKGPIVSGDGSANLRFRSLSGDVRLSGFSAAQPPQPQANREDSMEILRALERGEIDVDEASRRLEGAPNRG
ncbi:MAG: DUF4097 family beta strand repeat-containing protein [Candidatus Limnocylindrales bacterium]